MKTTNKIINHLLGAVLTFGLTQGAAAQNMRPGRPSLPPVALPAAVNGLAAIAALADHLPGVALHYGLPAQKLAELFRKDGDLWVDEAGWLYFAESHLPDPAKEAAPAEGGQVQAALVPVEQTFLLHSRPSATKKIYLDFDGHTTSGTSWRDYTDHDRTFVTPPYDFDGDSANFSVAELERIQYIWQRVAEDYAPFDVDVTTEDPGVEGLRKTTSGDVNYGIRVCIGGASTDWYSPNAYGGVAYIGSFDSSSDTPCYVWENNLSNGNEKYVAEAISHEVGHTLDLYHDGTSTVTYYEGHGTGADGWAPIMGVGYLKPVAQFSKGEYLDANNPEDDLAKITASYNIPYIADDYGDDLASAATLSAPNLYAEGLIERNTDVDVFRFQAGAGDLSITIGVDTRSPNLNVEATLYNSQGEIVAVSNPAESLGAALSLAGLPADTYYLKIDGVGAADPLNTGYSDYGSIGTYLVTGTVPPSSAPVATASATPTSGLAPLSVEFSSAGSSDPDGGLLSFHWAFGDGQTSTEAAPTHTYQAAGAYTAVLTVTDVEGLSASAGVAITVQDVPLAAPSSLTARAASTTRIDLTWTDNASDEEGYYVERSADNTSWLRIATLPANTRSYSDTGLVAQTTYSYRVQAFIGSRVSAYSNAATTRTKNR